MHHLRFTSHMLFGLVASLSIPGCQTVLVGTIVTDSGAGAGSTAVESTTSGEGSSGGGATAQCMETGCEQCVPEDHLGCHDGHVHWFDSCDQVGAPEEQCGAAGCTNGACAPECVPHFAITANACPEFSTSDGSGPGGGESMVVCGETDLATGHLQIRVHKRPGSLDPVFDDRPYQVRVAQLADGPCGPDRFYYDISDPAPSGVGTEELAFNFSSTWLGGQDEKAYCVTASQQPGDPNYNPADPTQQTWYWSDQIVLTRTDACD